MASILENGDVLGQVEVATPNALVALYTVPTAISALISIFAVNNPTGSPIKYAWSVAKAGAADSNKQYLAGSTTAWQDLDTDDTIEWGSALTLGPGDVVRAKADTAGVIFQVYGVQRTRMT